MNSGDLVITTNSVVQLDQPRTGMVVEPVDDDPERVWISLNIMGTHLPQMYRRSELEPATRELCERHDLCVECLGYGRVRPDGGKVFGLGSPPVCEECHGSGSTRYYVEVRQSADGSVIEGRVIPREQT